MELSKTTKHGNRVSVSVVINGTVIYAENVEHGKGVLISFFTNRRPFTVIFKNSKLLQTSEHGKRVLISLFTNRHPFTVIYKISKFRVSVWVLPNRYPFTVIYNIQELEKNWNTVTGYRLVKTQTDTPLPWFAKFKNSKKPETP